jgi:hypothetical protein
MQFEVTVFYRTLDPASAKRAIDVSSHPDSDTATGAKTRPPMPRWVRVFGVITAIAVVILAAFHHAGGWMAHHGDMGAHTLPAEHGQHAP